MPGKEVGKSFVNFAVLDTINPNTAKNQKIVKELLDYGKIAA
jgi:hypothetical protein